MLVEFGLFVCCRLDAVAPSLPPALEDVRHESRVGDKVGEKALDGLATVHALCPVGEQREEIVAEQETSDSCQTGKVGKHFRVLRPAAI